MVRVLLARVSPEGLISKPLGPPPTSTPLGLLYVAGALRRWCRADVEVMVGSLSVDVHSLNDLEDHIARAAPHVVGLSALTIDEGRLLACARAAKKVGGDIAVVAGGPLPTLDPGRCLAEPAVDWVVVGEGERTMAELVDALAAGDDPRRVPGLAYRGPDGVSTSPPRPFVRDLDELPSPAWDLGRLKLFSRMFNFHDLPPLAPPYAPISTMRGCPWSCIYCHDIFGRRPRLHSAERVVDEMRMLHDEFGIREFHVVDDIFNVDARRLLDICDGIRDSGLGIKLAFPNGLRGDILTKEQLEKLAEAGCYSVTFALETASERLQKLVRKRLDVDRVLENASHAASLGLITSCYVMLGFPTETREEMERTIDTVVHADFDLPRVFTVCPFPGTALHDLAKDHGFDDSRLTGEGFDYDRAAVNASPLPDEEFREVVAGAKERIFNHPPRIERMKRIVAMYRSPDDPYFRLGPWKTLREKQELEASPDGRRRVVLAMFHTLAREGRFSGNMQLSLLSGDLYRMGVDHELVAMVMKPSDRAQNDRTVEEFIDLMRRWRPDHIVLYAMWLPWIADTLREVTGARVMSLDPAQPGDVAEPFYELDTQAGVIATAAGAESIEEALPLLTVDDAADRFDPRFDYRLIGTDEPVKQRMAFVSMLSCPYDARIEDNPLYADLEMGPDVSRRGCSYCNGARHYEPMDEGHKRRVLTHQIRTLEERLPDLDEIAVPFPEDYLRTLAHVFRNAAASGIRPIVLSGQFRADSIVDREDEIDDMLDAAAEGGFEFHMNVVGLESFLDEDLELFNRGDSRSVRGAVAALRRLRSRHDPDTFMPTTVGSFILFHPWQTLDGLRRNVTAMRAHGLSGLFSSININDMRFHPGVPMYHLAARDDLLAPVSHHDVQDVPLGGYFSESPWRFAHSSTALVHELFTGLASRIGDRIGLLDSCLRIQEEHPGVRPSPELVIRELSKVMRRVTEIPLPRSGRRHVVRVGSRTNTAPSAGLFEGLSFPDGIDAARAAVAGVDLASHRVTVAGPEPTLLRWLPSFVRELVRDGAREVEVLTHGRMLAYESYAAALAGAGTHLVTMLVHSTDPDLHDEVVRVPGCFAQATGGLRRLREVSGGRVATALAVVVGPHNAGRLLPFADLARDLGCRELRLVVGLGGLDLHALGQRRQEMEDTLRAAARHRIAVGFDAELSLEFSL